MPCEKPEMFPLRPESHLFQTKEEASTLPPAIWIQVTSRSNPTSRSQNCLLSWTCERLVPPLMEPIGKCSWPPQLPRTWNLGWTGLGTAFLENGHNGRHLAGYIKDLDFSPSLLLTVLWLNAYSAMQLFFLFFSFESDCILFFIVFSYSNYPR